MPEPATQPSILVYSILLLAFLLSVPIAHFLIFKYRRAVMAGMGYTSSRFKLPTEHAPLSQGNRIAPEVKVVSLSEAGKAETDLFNRLKKSLLSHWMVYAVSTGVFSFVVAFFFLTSGELLAPLRYGYMMCVCFVPFLPLTHVLLSNSKRDTLMRSLIVIMLFFVVTGMLVYTVDNDEFTFSSALIPFVVYNALPLLIVYLLRLGRIKAIGIPVYVFILVCIAGPVAFVFYLNQNPQVLEFLGFAFIDAGFTAQETFNLWLTLPLLISIPIAWLVFRFFVNLYKRKQINDLQLQADAIIILFNIHYAIFIALSEPLYGLLSLLAFPAYKVVSWILFRSFRTQPKDSIAPRMLVLRVFALGAASRRLFNLLLLKWRYAGSVQLIAGPDLATNNIQPGDLLAFMSGRLKYSFCDDHSSIEKNVSLADYAPDADNTYRVNEFFCRENTWQTVLKTLIHQTEVVVMDLRRFSEQFKGCKYEIEALIHSVSLDKVIFMIDQHTDLPFTKSVIQQAFQQADPNSVNAASNSPVVVYKLDSRKNSEVLNIFKVMKGV